MVRQTRSHPFSPVIVYLVVRRRRRRRLIGDLACAIADRIESYILAGA